MTGPMIEIAGLRKAYGRTPVLRGVDLVAPRGSIHALLGRNGAGKTTTVQIMTTLVQADAGTVRVCGADVARQPRRVRELVALTGQYASVDEFQTGRENLVMMANLAHLPRREIPARVDALLERLDLVAAADRRVATYSGGMRRRLDLATSLLGRPALLVLDEPSTGLDPASRTQLWELVKDLADEGTTILLTTQYLEEADQLADTVTVLHDGVVAACGSPTKLKGLVSGAHVRAVFADQRDRDRARDLAPDVALEVGETDEDEASLTVRAADPLGTIRALLGMADSHGLSLEGVNVVRPTLDDVFLALTSPGVTRAATTSTGVTTTTKEYVR